MEISGRIKKIFETKEISASFRKRELVVTTEEQYPQQIMVEFTQDKVSELDKFKEGDKVQVNINIRGREWTSPQGEVKYFNTIQGWRISALEAQGGAAEMPPMDSETADDAMGEDDLPF
jgi:translation initiation factor IF-3